MYWGETEGFLAQGTHVAEESFDLVLKTSHLVGHLLELVRILETVRATIGRIETLEVEMATSLTRVLAITLDFPALALVTADVEDHGQ